MSSIKFNLYGKSKKSGPLGFLVFNRRPFLIGDPQLMHSVPMPKDGPEAYVLYYKFYIFHLGQ